MPYPRSFEGVIRVIPLVEWGAVPARPALSTGLSGRLGIPPHGHNDLCAVSSAGPPVDGIEPEGQAWPERVGLGSTEITAVKRRKARRPALWAGSPFR
jgi:hypothetical protein